MYEELLKEAEQHGVDIMEVPLTEKIKGLYGDGVIWINKNISTTAEKVVILAEEMGHHHKTVGNILDQKYINNRKQERLARDWSFDLLIPLSKIVQAHQAGVSNLYEVSEYLGLPEHFVGAALKRYREKYGISVKVGPHIIFFDPLRVVKENE